MEDGFELWLREDMEGNSRHLFCGAVLEFAWKDWGKPREL
jgi:hypothetical protein